MASHNDLGKKGEELAAQWLKENGFQLLHRNWRYSYYEIDVVAMKDGILHFIEVKTRKSDYFGYPEDSVTKRKFKKLQAAADMFLSINKGHRWVQYDILSIICPDNGKTKFFWLDDVYLW